jgi:hypothetical protein
VKTADPGDQERGRRRAPKKTKEPSLFEQPEQAPREKSEGEQRKDKALEKHEASGRAPLIRFLRAELKKLFQARDLQYCGDHAFVTADDAVRILKESKVVPQNDDGTDEQRNWMGALFKEPGWRYTGRSVPSLRKELNSRHVRCWRWEGA